MTVWWLLSLLASSDEAEEVEQVWSHFRVKRGRFVLAGVGSDGSARNLLTEGRCDPLIGVAPKRHHSLADFITPPDDH